ncbi:coagulation factor 5/8 type domain-containing protein [Actinosynnema sp.]|uniref:coagulation factor 5/8 type domain-containing protein n=1 Tax=Actinosynnema sp. TaxID=1872144 RepID=UPI003F874544
MPRRRPALPEPPPHVPPRRGAPARAPEPRTPRCRTREAGAPRARWTAPGRAGEVTAITTAPTDPRSPDLGPNVLLLRPGQPDAQRRVDEITRARRTDQFGEGRHAVLLLPGHHRLDVDLRFYTQVAGLGALPDDVVVQGRVRVEADWLPQLDDPAGLGNATQNFWRGAENLSVTPPPGQVERWAVSQAAAYRRMHLRGPVELWDGRVGWASGGLIADSRIDGPVDSGTQQQFLTRNSELGAGWRGSSWNMVFVGTTGAPAHSYPDPPFTTVESTPLVREKPFLFVADDEFRVFLPAPRRDCVGTSWGSGAPEGTSLSLAEFFVARPGTPVAVVNSALERGKHLLLTPGVHRLDGTITVRRPGTVVLGLGLATLTSETGGPALVTSDVPGIRLAGFLIDAGRAGAPVLLRVGEPGCGAGHRADPISLHDVYLRVGGPWAGRAEVSLEVNSSDVLIDHTWAWRADHGEGVGWDVNTARDGVVVNGDRVVAHGLFTEHYQRHSLLWNGEEGRVYFFQNELPYDPPSQAEWRGGGGARGLPGYKVADHVRDHRAWGLGVYCFNEADPTVVTDTAVEAPTAPGVRLTSLVAVSLGGVGTIASVVNGTGGAADSSRFVSRVARYPA